MRLGMLFLFLAICQNVFAQVKLDSAILLQEVSAIGNFEKQFLPGNKIILPQEKTIRFYQSETINEVLRQQSSIHFKEYGGSGMLSTIAFRGTNASQTSVLWNNFNINSFTLGLTDFSLLPMQAADEISIIPGSGSSMGGNGAFGGAVLLQNQLDFNIPHQISLQQQLGSFSKINSALNARGSMGKWAYNTHVYWAKAQNDFEIPITNEKQENAAFERFGVNQSLGFQIDDKNRLQAALWWNDHFREIQPPIGVSRALNNQFDRNLRSTLSYNRKAAQSKMSVGTGFFSDEMIYRLDRAISYLKVQRLESFADYKYYLPGDHTLKFTGRHNYIAAENDSYEGGGATEQRFSLGLLLNGTVAWDLDYALHLRQQLVRGVNIPLAPYLGFSFPLMKQQNNSLLLKANSSYNYRLPTLNDRYWNELFNPELNAETAWNKEFSVESSHTQPMLKLNTSLTLFHNQVDDWIQWKQDTSRIWRPRNIKEVVAKGLETNVILNVAFNDKLKLEAGASYSYIKSTVIKSEIISEVGKQLIYTPFHKANANISLIWRKFSLDTFCQYTGRVYTTNNNSETQSLDPFLLSDFGLSWHSEAWQLSGRIKNIFNSNYQMYSGYATPGRNYQLSITYLLKFKKQ